MTKPFRLEEQVAGATRSLRQSDNWPIDFYALLRSRGVEPLESVLLNATPDQNCICMRLIDQHKRIITFDLEYDGSPGEPKGSAPTNIVDWNARATEGEDWWWREHSRMTEPKPNNPIAVGLKMLETLHNQ